MIKNTCAKLCLFVLLVIFLSPGICADSLIVSDKLSAARSTDGSYIHWVENRVDDQALSNIPLRGADGFEVADFDKDGFLDAAIMYEDSNHLRLAFGSADPLSWEVITIAQGSEVQEIEDGAVGDLNGDGWPDLLVANEGGSLLYLQNPGKSARTATWQRAVPDGTTNRGSWIRVYLADLNGDNKLEAIATNKGVTMPSGEGTMDVPPTPVSWFSIGYNPLEPSDWQEHALNRTVVPVNAVPVDLDSDGDIDIVAGSRGESRLFWFENTTDEPGAQPGFVEHQIQVSGRHIPSLQVPGALSGFHLAFTDLNKDDRLDIIVSETPYSLVWLKQPENTHSRSHSLWEINPIGTLYPDTTTGFALNDINGDGLLDLMVGSYSSDPRHIDDPEADRNSRAGLLAWFEQPQNLNDDWKTHHIKRTVRGMYDAFYFTDLDKDGLDDALATRGNSGEYDGLFWLKHKRSDQPVPVLTVAREKESRSLPLSDSIASWFAEWLLE